MESIRNCYRGEVYIADLGKKPEGVKDCEQYGERPVVIIQNNIGNRFSPTTIIAPITTHVNKTKIPTHVKLDGEYIGLYKESMAMLEQIRTLDKRKLKEKVGDISPKDRKKINTAAALSLNLLSIEEKNLEIIEEKVNDIKKIDDHIKYAIKNGVDIEDFFEGLIEEREAIMEDLESFCKANGLNHNDFLKGNNKRKISKKNNKIGVC
ncbi:type II toxin-antitoxin system PemK/MazF family toxin [Clostridium perfringens]|nr:type II toxin-antitoxin system PemK/MazF family toxin [Clostridium perfringens]MDC4245579.1 type II toxin-antitoxin system PemK/MazF family toxin [Clostridium perfringens]